MGWAGKYNEIIKIYDDVKKKSEYGVVSVEKDLIYTTKAQVLYTGGRRSVVNDQINTPYTKTFIVRYYVPVTDTSTIEYKGERYRVTSIDSSREFQEITITTTLILDDEQWY